MQDWHGANTRGNQRWATRVAVLHGGHRNLVSDFSWNPCEDWTVASIAADNSLQIWQMAEGIHGEEDDLKNI